MRARAAFAALLWAALVARADEEPPVNQPFEEAVARALAAVQKAAPAGVRVAVTSTTPAKLGWDAPAGTPARRLEVATPGGVVRALGLLPRRGSYAPLPPDDADPTAPRPSFVAIGPDLVLVASPTQPAALTLDVIEAARPKLEAALGPLLAWAAVVADPARAREKLGLARPEEVEEAIAHPHALEVVARRPLSDEDRAALAAAGVGAVAWRVGAGPPAVAILK